MSEFLNSVDVIRPVVERLNGAPDYQVLGGIVSTALRHRQLIIDMDAKELHVPEHVLSTRRPNHSKRDADILVTSSNPDRIQEVKQIAREELHRRLTLAVCSVHPYSELQHLYDVALSRPLGKANFTSDRYEAAPDGSEVMKVLSPFAVPLHPETLEQWHLIINNELSIPVSHPGATLANYSQRSISGIRPKDYVKIKEAAMNIFSKEPQLLEWLKDGLGKSQMELTQILYSLRLEAIDGIRILGEVDLDLLSKHELMDSPHFMGLQGTDKERESAVDFAFLKAKRAYGIESSETLVKMLNNGVVERSLSFWTNNS